MTAGPVLPLLAVLIFLSLPALADDVLLRPSARLVFKHPQMLAPGNCVRYEEGGSGWGPAYYLTGTVIAAEIRSRHLAPCPVVSGKNPDQYSRDEFNRLALAFPCVAPDVPARNEQIGIVRLRVEDWETPHGVRAANAGRLYRGMLVERKLAKGMEIELEADLLIPCSHE